MSQTITNAILSVVDGNHREVQIPAFRGKKGDTGATGARGPQGIPGSKGDRGDIGPQGREGISGAFSSANIYSEKQCLDFSSRLTPVSWSDQEIKEDKKDLWKPDNLIILSIPCSNGDCYISIQKVLSATSLQPQSYWINKKGTDGKIPQKGVDYFTEADIHNIVQQTSDSIHLREHHIELIKENLPATSLQTYYGVNAENAKKNTNKLQKTIMDLSAAGGGTIYIPEGSYCFTYTENNPSGNTSSNISGEEYYCIKMFSNVSIVGDGATTILKPINREIDLSRGVDMFYYNDYTEHFTYSGGIPSPSTTHPVMFLENCRFKDFNIDAEHTEWRYDASQKLDYYNSSSKGFMFNLMKNCHWENVNVYNTIGTGIGVDCPIECSIFHCTVDHCGRGAKYREPGKAPGASGIGIGYGYSRDESMTISGCTCTNNGNFGIFIEHQCRFKPECYQRHTYRGFIITDCICEYNYNNFGGIMLSNSTFANCYSGGAKANGFMLSTCVNCTIDSCISNYEAHDADSPNGISFIIKGEDWSRTNRVLLGGIVNKCSDNEIRNSTSKNCCNCVEVVNIDLLEENMTRNCVRDCFFSAVRKQNITSENHRENLGKQVITKGIQNSLVLANLHYVDGNGGQGEAIHDLQGRIKYFSYERHWKAPLAAGNCIFTDAVSQPLDSTSAKNTRMTISDGLLQVSFNLIVNKEIKSNALTELFVIPFFPEIFSTSGSNSWNSNTYFTIFSPSNIARVYGAAAEFHNREVKNTISGKLETMRCLMIYAQGNIAIGERIAGSVVIGLDTNHDSPSYDPSI